MQAEYAPVKVFKTEKKGWGLLATKTIPSYELLSSLFSALVDLSLFVWQQMIAPFSAAFPPLQGVVTPIYTILRAMTGIVTPYAADM